VSTHGGKRPGAGRKHRLTPSKREEVAREYHDRKTAYAAAQAFRRDPNTKERRAINKQMRDVAKTHIAMPGDERELLDPEEDVVWTDSHKPIWPKLEKLKAEFDSISNESPTTPKRAKGVRERFLQEIADKFKISEQTVVRCIREFKNIFDCDL
jgi:hypothetical protein